MSVSGIDDNLTFYPLRIALLTVSDSRDEESDRSGALLAERLTTAGHELAAKAIVKDEVDAIQAQVRAWVADGGLGRLPGGRDELAERLVHRLDDVTGRLGLAGAGDLEPDSEAEGHQDRDDPDDDEDDPRVDLDTVRCGEATGHQV